MPTLNWNRHRILTVIVALICFATLFKAMVDLWRIFSPVANGALDMDATIYFIVGRGILNGLRPYVDLFESKPPEMFLLTALSLITTGTQWIATAADILAKLSLPVLLAAYAASKVWRSGSHKTVLWLCSTAFLIGVLITLYLDERVGAVQTETFGTFFACLYLLHIAWNDSTRWPSTLARSLLLMCAIGMKEPFVLTVFAGALLLARDIKQFWHSFVIPLMIAAVLGLIGLWVLGYWHSYFGIYLPAMLGERVTNSPVEPLFVRSFSIEKVLYNLTIVYSAWGFGIVVACLWVLFPLWKACRANLFELLLIITGSALGFFVLRFTWVLAVFFRAAYLAHANVWMNFVYIKFAEYLILLLGFFLVLFFQSRQKLARHTLVAMAATLPISAAVGVAGYPLQHWAFACPFYFVLALVFISYAATEKPKVISGIMSGMIIFVVILFGPSKEHLHKLNLDIQNSAKVNADIAHQFDGLLDACGIGQYAGFGVFKELAFSKHSPIGPIFVPEFHKYLGEDHPLFTITYQNIEKNAEVLVLKKGSTPFGVFSTLVSQFTDKPPACAQKYLPIDDLNILFRMSAHANQP